MPLSDFIIEELEKEAREAELKDQRKKSFAQGHTTSSDIDSEALADLLSRAIDISSAQKLYKELGRKLNSQGLMDKNQRKLFSLARRYLENEFGQDVREGSTEAYSRRSHVTIPKKLEVVGSQLGGLQLLWIGTNGEPITSGDLGTVLYSYVRQLKIIISEVEANPRANKKEKSLAEQARTELRKLKELLRRVSGAI